MKNSIAVSLVVLLSAMGISACGGSRSVRDTETRAPTIITDADGNTEQIETTRSLTTHTVVLEMPMETAYRRLLAAYDVLGIEANAMSERERFVGARNLRLRRRLGNRRLSTLLNCGAGMTGPNADQYEITLSIISELRPAGTAATQLTSRIDATARPMGVSGNTVYCSTTGRLETEIAETVEGD
ncbi:MAG TPA: hypothetical protein VKZ41_09215 [Gemmatimonadales bacterium]|nr:hypothetical protein [Gemmatimonadales bacterium]